MDKADHGRRLKQAMAAQGYDRQTVSDAAGVQPRTVTNWTSGKTMPDPRERESLRRLFPGYDSDGDAVEVAVRRSGLEEWRQNIVIGTYQMHISEQARVQA